MEIPHQLLTLIYRRLIRKRVYSILSLIIIFLCCNSFNNKDDILYESEILNQDRSLNEYSRDSMLLDSLLKTSSLKLVNSQVVEIDKIPLQVAYKRWLLFPQNIKVERCLHANWANGNDNLHIWTIEFSNMQNMSAVLLRLDSVCNNLMQVKTGYRKKFRGHKLYNKKLVLFQHKFYSVEQRNMY